MTDTFVNDPTADQGPFRINRPGVKGGLPEVPKAPPPPLPGTSDTITKLEALQKKEEEDFAKTQQALAPQYSALSKTYQERPTPAELAKIGPAPDARDYQKNSLAFASAMAIIGAIGSKFARIPGTAALSAFGGALEGWRTGNLEAYENGVKQWEENARAVIQNNNILLKKYDMEMQNRALNIDQISANIKMIAAQYHDKQMYDAASAQNITLMGQLRDKVDDYTNGPKGLERSIQPMLNDAARIRAAVDLKAEQQALWVAQHGFTNPDGSPMSVEDDFKTRYLLQREGGKAMSAVPSMYNPTEIDQLARQELTGDHSWKANVGRGAQGSAKLDAVSQRVSEIMTAEGITPEERSRRDIAFQARRAEATAGGRTKGVRETNLDIILNVADSAIPAALAASEKVPRGRFVPINRIIQQGKVATSDTALAQFGMANLQLAEGWARAMNPTGVMRESDRDLALSFLSTATSKETYKALVEQLRTQIERERAAIQSGQQSVLSAPGGGSIPPAAAPTTGEIPPGWNVQEH